MIKIRPSPTADTRTCDWSKVTKETLLASSKQHIRDVREGLAFFADRLARAGMRHDHDKILAIEQFHADFRTGFKQTGWWDNHRKVNRHHLTAPDGIPADVNLIDVLDHVVDCVMAGMARSGSLSPLALEPALLKLAFDNTVALLVSHVEVVPSPAPSRAEERCAAEGPVDRATGNVVRCALPKSHDGERHDDGCMSWPVRAPAEESGRCACGAVALTPGQNGKRDETSWLWHRRDGCERPPASRGDEGGDRG